MTQLYLSEKFGSDHDGYRQLIRAELAAALSGESFDFDASEILSLQKLPKVTGAGISIAHARGLGGFVLSREHSHVGFDVELTSRITAEAVNRICTTYEKYPHHDLMWVAKEASYKALGNKGIAPEVITGVEISDWLSADERTYTYSFNGGTGRAWREGEYSLALSFFTHCL